MRLARVLLTIVVALTITSATATAQCPSSGWDVGFTSGSSTQPIYSAGGASWNLIEGRFSGGASGATEMGGFLSMTVRDIYRIVGPASAVPIPFRARVVLSGHASGSMETVPGAGSGCFGSSVTFELIPEGGLPAYAEIGSSQSPCAGVDIDAVVELALAKLPGEEFLLRHRFYISSGAYQTAFAEGLLTFLDLPPGYSIASCQGYVGPAVPTSNASWGQLKHTYR
jgi:hypothetical protein